VLPVIVTLVERIRAKLRGGTFDGEVREVDPHPRAARFYFSDGDKRWSELYLFLLGETEYVEGEGDLPVMVLTQRRDEEPDALS
jgi:hypothetical protein